MFEDILTEPEDEIEMTTTPEKYCGYCAYYIKTDDYCKNFRTPVRFFTASCVHYKEID